MPNGQGMPTFDPNESISGLLGISPEALTQYGPLALFGMGDASKGGTGASGDSSATGGFKSGFRPYPAGGQFPLVPPANKWQGGNFMVPGVSSQPLMTSDIASRFPSLAAVLGGGAPPAPAAAAPSTPDIQALIAQLMKQYGSLIPHAPGSGTTPGGITRDPGGHKTRMGLLS